MISMLVNNRMVRYIHALILIRYGYCSSHPRMNSQAKGKAIKLATITIDTYSRINMPIIVREDAPVTFRIATSFRRWVILLEDTEYSPKTEMSVQSIASSEKSCRLASSDRLNSFNTSLTVVISGCWSYGSAYFLYASRTALMAFCSFPGFTLT